MLGAIHIQYLVTLVFMLIYCVTVLGLVVVVIAENRNPLKTIPWVIVLLFAPVVGLIFYFFFGQDNRKQKIISRRTYKRIMKRPKEEILPQDVCCVPEEYKPLAALLVNTNQSSLLYGSKITVYTNGREKFDALLEEISKATHHIHLQYYIFCDDAIGNKVKEALITKAKEGVQVRVLYDDVGCWNVKVSFFNEMKAAGIEVYAFLRVVFPVLTSKVNYRNHRKVVVIDGKVGFVGGMNIADRYVKGNEYGKWRDTHYRIEGKGVHGLQSAFLIDWYVVSKILLNSKRYYPPAKVFTNNMMQIATCGPVGPWRTILQATIFALANAKRYIYIQTPYFLPTESLNTVLQVAALGGIDVRLMLPKKADSKMINWASRSFIDELVKAGVKVYFYTGGFLHAKLIVIDDALTAIGSANMDFRSLEHNFEINAFLYDTSFAEQMKKIFQHDLLECEKLVPSRWKKRSVKKRFMESFMRLFSPLL
ncbi:cardiolipin synthase [Parabacteroides pacaensis]|uniref:cardiolipin synthase n=1 Tax=Parabacteroides pacaensis TaxID=2086575 RepID=UPI000D102E39|nr:cardiolipin synthase [Parabacteroides pacaensis]